MKKLILCLLLSLTALLGTAQTRTNAAGQLPAGNSTAGGSKTELSDPASTGNNYPMLAALFSDKRPTRSNYYLLSEHKKPENKALKSALGLTGFALTQGTGITAFSYDGSAAATVSINQAFTPTWTGLHTFNNSVSGTAYGVIFNPAQAASANNQVEAAMHIAPTYSDGSFTGSIHTPLLIDWDGTAHFSISNITNASSITFHASAVPTTTNYFLKQEGSSIYLNAPSSTGAVGFRINGTNTMSLGSNGILTINNLAAGVIFSSGGALTRIANGTANQLLGMTSAGNAYEYKTVSGSAATGAVVTNGTGTITLSNDTTKLQTVANFFPKGDARYLRSVSGLTAGGDLSGTLPNPTVAKFNGQLPAYYLNFANLTNLPTTLAGYSITDGVSLTGTQTLTNKTLTAPAITSPTGLVSADVGLGNVNNTSDMNKPVSTAQQTALNAKATDASVVHTTGNESVGGIKNFTSQLSVGTTTIPSGYTLAVNGSAIVTAITVKLQTNWPDYVFTDQYKLRSLSELSRFITLYHHLPDMPAAAEVAKNGQDLGEINVKLTQKVEELSLYLIEKDKQVNDLQMKMKAQEERLKKIEAALLAKSN